MYKPVLFINIGLPGSGKSTFCENHMRHFPIISRDRIRFSLLKNEDAYFSNEKEVFEQFCSEIAKWLKKGKSCVADATHLNITSRARLVNKLEKLGCGTDKYNICFLYYDIPVEVCLERNAHRTGRAYVPEHVIREMMLSLKRPNLNEFPNAFHMMTITEEDEIDGDFFVF